MTVAQAKPSGRVITAAWLAGASMLGLFASVQQLRDSDVWWHLALGQYTIAHGLPAQEPFTFPTPHAPWVGQQWLYEVLLAKLVSVTPALASAFMGMVASAAFLIATHAGPRRIAVPGAWRAAAMLATIFGSAELLGVRGQIFTILGASIVMWIISRWREGNTRLLWLVPPLLLIWCNLHAGFIFGIGLLLVAAVLPQGPSWGINGRRRPLLLATAIGAAATLVNPAGFALGGYVLSTFGNSDITQRAAEWLSPDFHDTWMRIFELGVIALVAAWTLTPGGPDKADVVYAGLALAGSLDAQRNIPLYAVIATPQLARYGHQAWEAHRHRVVGRWRLRPMPPRVATLYAGVLLLVVAAATARALSGPLSQLDNGTYEATAHPEAAVTYVAQHFPGQRIYAADVDAGYIAYRIPVGRVVFIYPEWGVFGKQAIERYLTISQIQPGWPATLAQLQIEHAVLAPTAPEVPAFYELGWSVDCYDVRSTFIVMSAPTSGVNQAQSSPINDPASYPHC